MIDGEFGKSMSYQAFPNTKTSKYTIYAEVRFGPACSKIPTVMPMGRRSGSLFNHTYSSQFSICDQTRFKPAVASSLSFSLWVDVRNSLLKRPNQRSFAIYNKERFGPACSNIKKTKKKTHNYDL